MLGWWAMDTAELQDLRRILATHNGRRLPSRLRERVVAFARRRRHGGATIRAVGLELGFSYETIRRWTSAAPADRVETMPVPVEIVAAAAAPAVERTVSVVSPAGFRVDGLSLDEAATLLRALR